MSYVCVCPFFRLIAESYPELPGLTYLFTDTVCKIVNEVLAYLQRPGNKWVSERWLKNIQAVSEPVITRIDTLFFNVIPSFIHRAVRLKIPTPVVVQD